jgi:hypothetical protein
VQALVPTGKYLRFNDATVGQMVVTYVSVPKTQLIESGAVIPGYPYQVTFSPPGLLLYAINNGQVLSFVFNPHSGLFTAKSAIADSTVNQIIPAK